MIKQMFFAVALITAPHYVYAQSDGVVVEWAPFEVRQGVSDAELMQASENLQNEFLIKQKGYIKRALLKGEGRQWVDLVYWESEDDANAAIQNAMKSEVCGAFFGLMEGMSNLDDIDPSEGVFHYKKMAGWE